MSIFRLPLEIEPPQRRMFLDLKGKIESHLNEASGARDQRSDKLLLYIRHCWSERAFKQEKEIKASSCLLRPPEKRNHSYSEKTKTIDKSKG